MFTLTGFADEISSDLSLQLEGLKELGIRHLELRGVWHWEDYLGPLIYLNSVSNYTVPLALRMFMDTQSAVQWTAAGHVAGIDRSSGFIVSCRAEAFRRRNRDDGIKGLILGVMEGWL